MAACRDGNRGTVIRLSLSVRLGKEVVDLNKVEKRKFVESYHEKLKKATTAILTDFQGLTVAQISEFRNELRKIEGTDYSVVKNTLTKRAAKGTDAEKLEEYMHGPTGIVLGFGDPVSPAKTCIEFAKKFNMFEIKAGIVEGQVADQNALKAIADLPSREQMLSNIAAGMNAPATKMARLLTATVARFGYAMNALVAQKS
jgi:large subunit ribosomal protein L10